MHGYWRFLRKPADQHHRPARLQHAKNPGATLPPIEHGLLWWEESNGDGDLPDVLTKFLNKSAKICELIQPENYINLGFLFSEVPNELDYNIELMLTKQRQESATSLTYVDCKLHITKANGTGTSSEGRLYIGEKVLRANEGKVRLLWSGTGMPEAGGGGGAGDPQLNLLTSSILRHYSHLRKTGSGPTGNRTQFALVGDKKTNHFTTERVIHLSRSSYLSRAAFDYRELLTGRESVRANSREEGNKLGVGLRPSPRARKRLFSATDGWCPERRRSRFDFLPGHRECWPQLCREEFGGGRRNSVYPVTKDTIDFASFEACIIIKQTRTHTPRLLPKLTPIENYSEPQTSRFASPLPQPRISLHVNPNTLKGVTRCNKDIDFTKPDTIILMLVFEPCTNKAGKIRVIAFCNNLASQHDKNKQQFAKRYIPQ
ncbi:hypothetical protein PR048_013632 [Dryococelus australis]|uniref:Uncharacterized protein n=1 Tax=Dryococelus australis TaxID=614101 RepID=A0ABQ9HSP9_9NEOP|nr:hypothetical protein PR048_013632 [Dryococelus australis]